MDKLFAWLGAVKDGEITEAEASKRWSRSPHWVGGRWPQVACCRGSVPARRYAKRWESIPHSLGAC